MKVIEFFEEKQKDWPCGACSLYVEVEDFGGRCGRCGWSIEDHEYGHPDDEFRCKACGQKLHDLHHHSEH